MLALALTSIITTQVGHAQAARGDRVRISLHSHAVAEGVFLGRDSLGYAVMLVGRDTALIPTDGSYAAERFVRREPRGMHAFGMSLGVGAGLGVGLFGLTVLFPPDHEPGVAAAASFIAAAGLTVVGAVVGVVMAGIDHNIWEPVSLSGSEVSPPTPFANRAQPSTDSSLLVNP